jgi:energy-coupling factor transporter ATP-binding protein EcfA2
MPSSIHGLRIAMIRGDGTHPDMTTADVSWRDQRVLRLPATGALPGAAVAIERDGVTWIEQVFAGVDGSPICRFLISGDGRRVLSDSLPDLHRNDRDSLFVEPVMRTILSRMGLVSFHASALVKQGAAVLIMGRKGAGKSSLAGALYQIGWQPLADDLVRMIDGGGGWHAAAGGTVPRVNADTARALGFDPGALLTRWSIPGVAGNKFLLPEGVFAPPPSEVPIRAVLLLDTRDPALESPRCARATGADALRGLIANLTPDPLAPAALPSREAVAVVGGVLRQAAIYRLSLPDRLDALGAAAATVDARLAREGAPVAA